MGVQVAAESGGEIDWSSEDLKCRDQLLHDAFTPPVFCVAPMVPPNRSPEIASLLCLPKHMMTNSLQVFLSNLSLVGSLMLAAIIKVALDPDDSKTFNPYKETLTNISNFLSVIIVSINAGIVLYSTYVSIQLTMDCEENIMRVVCHSGGLVYFQFFAFLSGLLVLVKTIIANYIYSTGIFKYLGIVVVASLFVFAWLHFFFTVGRMFPYVRLREHGPFKSIFFFLFFIFYFSSCYNVMKQIFFFNVYSIITCLYLCPIISKIDKWNMGTCIHTFFVQSST
jgi:hypothetical protein